MHGREQPIAADFAKYVAHQMGPRLRLLQEIFAGEFRRCPLGPGRDQRRSDLNQHASWQQLRGGNFRYRDLTGPCVLKKLLHAVAAV
jgi:hypothetical protein